MLWPTASDIAVQANVSFQVNCGSRWHALERPKMTLFGHEHRWMSSLLLAYASLFSTLALAATMRSLLGSG